MSILPFFFIFLFSFFLSFIWLFSTEFCVSLSIPSLSYPLDWLASVNHPRSPAATPELCCAAAPVGHHAVAQALPTKSPEVVVTLHHHVVVVWALHICCAPTMSPELQPKRGTLAGALRSARRFSQAVGLSNELSVHRATPPSPPRCSSPTPSSGLRWLAKWSLSLALNSRAAGSQFFLAPHPSKCSRERISWGSYAEAILCMPVWQGFSRSRW